MDGCILPSTVVIHSITDKNISQLLTEALIYNNLSHCKFLIQYGSRGSLYHIFLISLEASEHAESLLSFAEVWTMCI